MIGEINMTDSSGFKETQAGYPVREPGESDAEFSLREAIFHRKRREDAKRLDDEIRSFLSRDHGEDRFVLRYVAKMRSLTPYERRKAWLSRDEV